MYMALAERLGDSRRAEIIRAIADAEASHRERIEKRLRDLGQPVPDPSSVKLSLLQRLQARLAPVETVLSRMDAAEEVELTDRYKRPTAGLFGAIAAALSMATGAYLAERSEGEVTEANVERERQEIVEHPEEEKEEVSLFYQLKGIDKEMADRLAEQLAGTPEALLKVHAPEELGVLEAAGNPVQSAIAAGVSTFIGAMIPVMPVFWVRGTSGVITAAVVSLIAHFLVGASKALFTLRTWWSAGLEMTLAGILVGGITYAIGLVLKVGG